MGRFRLSFTERRRARLAKQVDRLDRLETRQYDHGADLADGPEPGPRPGAMALGLPRGYGSGIGAIPHIAPDPGQPGAGLANAASHAPIAPGDVLPLSIVPRPAGGGGAAPVQDAATRPAPAGDDDDWLTLSPAADPSATQSGISTPWQPAKTAGGGAAMAPRGGSGNGAQAATIALVRGQVTPFRVPAPSRPAPAPPARRARRRY